MAASMGPIDITIPAKPERSFYLLPFKSTVITTTTICTGLQISQVTYHKILDEILHSLMDSSLLGESLTRKFKSADDSVNRALTPVYVNFRHVFKDLPAAWVAKCLGKWAQKININYRSLQPKNQLMKSTRLTELSPDVRLQVYHSGRYVFIKPYSLVDEQYSDVDKRLYSPKEMSWDKFRHSLGEELGYKKADHFTIHSSNKGKETLIQDSEGFCQAISRMLINPPLIFHVNQEGDPISNASGAMFPRATQHNRAVKESDILITDSSLISTPASSSTTPFSADYSRSSSSKTNSEPGIFAANASPAVSALDHKRQVCQVPYDSVPLPATAIRHQFVQQQKRFYATPYPKAYQSPYATERNEDAEPETKRLVNTGIQIDDFPIQAAELADDIVNVIVNAPSQSGEAFKHVAKKPLRERGKRSKVYGPARFNDSELLDQENVIFGLEPPSKRRMINDMRKKSSMMSRTPG